MRQILTTKSTMLGDHEHDSGTWARESWEEEELARERVARAAGISVKGRVLQRLEHVNAVVRRTCYVS